MDTATIVSLALGALATLWILAALVKVVTEFRKFLGGLIAAAEDGQITSDEFRQAAKDWADVTSAGTGVWKAIKALIGK